MFRDYYLEMFRVFTNEAKFRNVKFKIKKKIYLLDSTLISLCLSIYDWARYTRSKGAIKLHMLLDYDVMLPFFIHISDGKKSDVRAAKNDIEVPQNSVVVADRAYVDFRLLNKWNQNKVKFVVRCKEDIKFIGYEERELPEDRSQNILKDEKVLLENPSTRELYPCKLRIVTVYDEENGTTLFLLTNDFTWTAETISELYRQRWQIEIFFRELKSLFKIKTFIGTSANAVMIQIWTALISILVLKYLKRISQYKWSLSNLVAFLRMNLFVKISLQEWLNHPFKRWEELEQELNPQLSLF